MHRIVVVSRNPAMAILLGSRYDVTAVRPSRLERWVDRADHSVDAVIIDIDDQAWVSAVVRWMREGARVTPVLVVSGLDPGWSHPLEQLGCRVVPVPATRPMLLDALAELLEGATPDRHDAPAVEVVPLARSAAEAQRVGLGDRIDTSTAVRVINLRTDRSSTSTAMNLDGGRTAVTGSWPGGRHAVPDDALPFDLEEAADAGHDGALPESHVSRADLPPALKPFRRTLAPFLRRRRAGAARPAPADGATGDASSLADEAIEEPGLLPSWPQGTHQLDTEVPGSRWQPTGIPDEDISDDIGTEAEGPLDAEESLPAVFLVRRLAERVDELYTVAETAEVVVGDAVDSVGADCGALLLPDDGRWRVAAGIGLRPLEQRYELTARSWLVAEVGTGHRGAIVEDTDVARQALAGAPLASARHLLAAPVPRVDAVLLMSREADEPFTEDDLSALSALGAEAGELLAEAVDVRALARRLHAFREDD